MSERALNNNIQKDMLNKFKKIEKDREKEIKNYLGFIKKIVKN
jgi:hypothetical protein